MALISDEKQHLAALGAAQKPDRPSRQAERASSLIEEILAFNRQRES